MDNYPTISLRYDRRHTATATKPGTVEILVSYKQEKLYIKTGVRVPLPSWRNERVVNHNMAATYNKMVTDAMIRVNDIVSALWADGIFSLKMLKDMLAQHPESAESPIEWLDRKIESHQVRETTRRHHRALVPSLRGFGKFMSWHDFTPTRISEYDAWLHTQKVNGHLYSQGTIRNYHKRLKVYLAIARREGLLDRDPYIGIKIERPKPAKRKYLTDEQRLELEQRPLTGALAHVRDLFLFQCYPGLSYADMAELDCSKDLVKEGDDTFIVGDRLKTGSHFKVMLLDKAKAILERYDWQLPVMTNQKYNNLLKIAAAGIRDDITSHMGRHTFATWALRNNVPIEVISAMLAHSNINVTQIYVEQQQEHVNEEYRRLNKL